MRNLNKHTQCECVFAFSVALCFFYQICMAWTLWACSRYFLTKCVCVCVCCTLYKYIKLTKRYIPYVFWNMIVFYIICSFIGADENGKMLSCLFAHSLECLLFIIRLSRPLLFVVFGAVLCMHCKGAAALPFMLSYRRTSKCVPYLFVRQCGCRAQCTINAYMLCIYRIVHIFFSLSLPSLLVSHLHFQPFLLLST